MLDSAPDICKVHGVQMKYFETKSSAASKLRKRKYDIVRRYGFSESLLPGSLTKTHRRCGKPTCHCATGDGHPQWVLSFSIEGNKHTHVVSDELATALAPLVERGREQREALAELMRLNAQLLRLWLGEQRKKKKRLASRRQ